MVSEGCVSTTALSTVNDTAQKSPAGVGTSCIECNVHDHIARRGYDRYS
jgi:hypothetical protein